MSGRTGSSYYSYSYVPSPSNGYKPTQPDTSIAKGAKLSTGAVVAAGCAAFLLVAGICTLGAWLVLLGRAHAQVKCETAVATFVTIQGYTILATMGGSLLIALCLGVLMCSGVFEAAFTVAYVLSVPMSLGSLASIGIHIWGTVLTFQDGLWVRMKAASPGNEPCNPALYFPAAIYLIVMWTAPLILPFLCCCTALCWCSLAELFACCCCCRRPASNGGKDGTNHEDFEAQAWTSDHVKLLWQSSPYGNQHVH